MHQASSLEFQNASPSTEKHEKAVLYNGMWTSGAQNSENTWKFKFKNAVE